MTLSFLMTFFSKQASPFLPLASEAELEAARVRSRQEPVVLFKHSITCSLSSAARRRLLALSEAGDPPVYELVVQHARPLSDRIATETGIRHHSPQVILLFDEKPVHHTSHENISAAGVRLEAARAARLS